MSTELEYNLAGELLLTLTESDFRQLQEGLIASGYEYGCILPFRALAKEGGVEELQKSPLKIVHLEEAWNPTNQNNLFKAVLAGLWGHYQRFRGDESHPPILQDALFPSKATCNRLFQELLEAFPEVKFISHEIDASFPANKLLVEINPGIKLSASEILAETEERGIGLVFDPSHLLSAKTISVPGEPVKASKGEWERQFLTFKNRIRIVDINPPQKSDAQELLRGRGVLKELALASQEIGVEFLRVEIPMPLISQVPGSLLKAKGFEFLKEVGAALKEGT